MDTEWEVVVVGDRTQDKSSDTNSIWYVDKSMSLWFIIFFLFRLLGHLEKNGRIKYSFT